MSSNVPRSGKKRQRPGRCLQLAAVFALAGSGLMQGGPPAESAVDALSPLERDIVRYVDEHNDQALALLERAVNINSGTMNLEGVREVGRLFQAEFDGLGFSTRWVEGSSFERAGHLVAERKGKGPHLLLIGHLDTVFEPDSPFQRFERLSESSAKGPGVVDMKGGDVVIIQALKALAAAGALDQMSVTVVMTGDEEKSGRPLDLARQALIEAAREADIAIGFEDGDGNPKTAVIARRSSSSWKLEVTGTPAHSSQIFREDIGPGAIFEAARILNRFREDLSGEQYLTFNPGTIVGGTTVDFDLSQARGTAFGKENVIAETAIISGDLRTISAEQFQRAKSAMEAIVAQGLPNTSARITFLSGGYPPLAPSEGNQKLLGIFDRVSRDLGMGPVTAVDPRSAGAADISFAAGLVEMALDGLGLMGDAGHTVEETADLSTLPSQTKRAAILLHRLGVARPSQAATPQGSQEPQEKDANAASVVSVAERR